MMSALLYFRLWFQVLAMLVNIIPFQAAVTGATFAAQHLHGIGHPVQVHRASDLANVAEQMRPHPSFSLPALLGA